MLIAHRAPGECIDEHLPPAKLLSPRHREDVGRLGLPNPVILASVDRDTLEGPWIKLRPSNARPNTRTLDGYRKLDACIMLAVPIE